MAKSHKPNILIFDPRIEACQRLEDLVDQAGACGLSALSVEEAFHVMDTIDLSLVLLGAVQEPPALFDLANRLCHHPKAKGLPLMFVCDRAWNEDTVLSAYEHGALDVLVKPLSPRVIQNKLRYLDRHESGKDVQDKTDFSKGMAQAAGSIAHQINNELTLISGHMELYLQDMEEDGQNPEFSSKVFSSVKRITAQTNKLLSMTKMGRSHHDYSDLHEILWTVTREWNGINDHIKITMNQDPGQFQLDADESQVKMIIRTLLKNASQALPETKRMAVSSRYIPSYQIVQLVEAASGGDWVLLELTGNEGEMDTDADSGLFEPELSTNTQVRGMDMAAVYGIVRHLKGFIKVDAVTGECVRFRVFLPVVRYSHPKAVQVVKPSAMSSGTVLVIANDDVIFIAEHMLKRLGYHYVTARTGKEALDLINTPSVYVDLTLLSTILPDMKGSEVYPHLTQAFPGMKVVVCSGYAFSDGPVQELMNKGAHDFLQKPFTIGDLSDLLRKNIERRKHARHKVKDGLIVFTENGKLQKNRLIDISKGGAAVHSHGPGDTEGAWRKMSIQADGGTFQIKDLPFRFIVREHEGPIALESGHKGWMNLQFGGLSPSQYRQVDDFISRYAL